MEGATSCQADSDCQVLGDQCGVGLGGCYAYVNDSLTQEELSALGQQFSDAGCTSGVCDCDVAREVACVENLCTGVDEPPPLMDTTLRIENAAGSEANLYWSCDTDDVNAVRLFQGERRLQLTLACGACECDAVVHDNCMPEQCELSCLGNDSLAVAAGDSWTWTWGGEFLEIGSVGDVDCRNRTRLQAQTVQAEVCWATELGENGEPVDERCESITLRVGQENVLTLMGEPSSCEEIEGVYADLVNSNRACDVDADCQILNGACGVGIGGCYELVNQNVSQENLNGLAEAWSAGECFGPVCDCAEPPARAVCNDGVCDGSNELVGPGCDADSGFVCGSNGRRYDNECAAADDDVDVLYAGDCRTCDDNDACEGNELCLGVGNLCGEGMFGRSICVPQPESCDVATPGEVCGCDGATYDNTCEARRAGVAVSGFGGCTDEADSTFACLDLTCDSGQVCNIAANDVAGPDQPDFYVSCADAPAQCDGAQSCDACYPDLDDFTTCIDGTGEMIIYYPGG